MKHLLDFPYLQTLDLAGKACKEKFENHGQKSFITSVPEEQFICDSWECRHGGRVRILLKVGHELVNGIRVTPVEQVELKKLSERSFTRPILRSVVIWKEIILRDSFLKFWISVNLKVHNGLRIVLATLTKQSLFWTWRKFHLSQNYSCPNLQDCKMNLNKLKKQTKV